MGRASRICSAMTALTIALPKGRVLEEALPLLARAGLEPAEDPQTSRRLVIGSSQPGVRFVVAAPRGYDYAGALRRGARLKVATKYVAIAREHFAAKGMHVDLIRLYGSMELAPLVGLADAIVDLVDTGSTLKANRLKAVEEVMPVSSRLIVNQAALK